MIAIVLIKQRGFAHWLSNTGVQCVKCNSIPHIKFVTSFRGEKTLEDIDHHTQNVIKIICGYCNWREFFYLMVKLNSGVLIKCFQEWC